MEEKELQTTEKAVKAKKKMEPKKNFPFSREFLRNRL